MENAVINLSICLSDLPKEKIQKAKNGKLYININIRKRKEPDQFGQDVYATVQQTKEEKEAIREGRLVVVSLFVVTSLLISFGERLWE